MQLIVPAGTQIVVKQGGAQDDRSRVGSVGVIVQVPEEETGRYAIRFPDGEAMSLGRDQFRILKVVREEAIEGPPEIDWRQFIIYRCVMGSRAFGLESENSDTDRRGIYLPPARLHWSLHGVPEQLEDDEAQETFWELGKFVRLALRANPGILEVLYSPLVEHVSGVAEDLLAQRDIFLSRLVYQTYNGYVLSQFKRLEQDLRTRGQIKWKHAMHLIRLLLSGIRILREGVVMVRVDQHRDRLLAIKHGEVAWDEVDRWRRELHRQFDESFTRTTLPERPNVHAANELLIRARRSMVEEP